MKGSVVPKLDLSVLSVPLSHAERFKIDNMNARAPPLDEVSQDSSLDPEKLKPKVER